MDINLFRWISFLAIVVLIAILEWFKHLFYMNVFSMNTAHILNVAAVAVVSFVILTLAFRTVDKLYKKNLELAEELKNKNKELEEKVAVRTKDLQKALSTLEAEHEKLESSYQELTQTYKLLQEDKLKLIKRERYALKEDKLIDLIKEMILSLKEFIPTFNLLKNKIGSSNDVDKLNEQFSKIREVGDSLWFWVSEVKNIELEKK